MYGGDVFGTEEADASAVCAFCPEPLTLLPCVQMLARGGTGAVDPTEGGGAGGEHSRVRPAAQLPAQVSTGAHEHPPPLPSLIIPSMQTIKGKLHSHTVKQTDFYVKHFKSHINVKRLALNIHPCAAFT